MVGIGYEYAFLGNWSAKIEYDYLGLGTERITVVTVPGITPPTRQFDVRQDILLVKVGINYRFGPTAVMARY
jgi:outer membrane immunogenic protein